VRLTPEIVAGMQLLAIEQRRGSPLPDGRFAAYAPRVDRLSPELDDHLVHPPA
jgi:hypothetical protein